MDLSDLKPKSDTVVVHLKHPITGDPITHDNGKPMTIKVYGAHAKEYKSVQNDIADNRLQTSFKDGERNKTLSLNELRESALELASRTVVSWDITMDGKKPKLSQESALKLFEDFDWILEQTQQAVNDFEAFLGK